MVNSGKPRSYAQKVARPAARVRWLLVLALLLPALPAGAETILLLGVVRDGKVDAKLSRAVQDRLLRAGETTVAPPSLLPADRLCATADCLDPLAGRQNVQLVLSARLQQSAGFAYIAAFLYDAVRQRNIDVSAVCDKCLPEAVALRVGDLFDRLLRDHRDRLHADASGPRKPVKGTAKSAPLPAPPPVVPPAPVVVAQQTPVQHAPPPPPITAPPADEPAARLPANLAQAQTQTQAAAPAPNASLATARHFNGKTPFSPRRKLMAGILGGLGVVALATAVGFHVTDGNPTSRDCGADAGMPKFCVLDNKLAYTVGYAVTSVFAVSLGMTLVWPEPAKSSRSEVK